MGLTDLENMDEQQLKTFLDSFDNVLCDCDGVVWHLGLPIPNVNKTIVKLKSLGKKVSFVTNNSYVSPADICQYMKKGGLDVELKEIINPCLALTDYLKKIKFSGEICVLASKDFKKHLISAGFDVVEVKVPDAEKENVIQNSSFMEKLCDVGNIKAVVIDLDFTVSYIKLLKVALCLQNPDVLFLVTCTDNTIPLGHGVNGFGPGYFIKPIQHMTNREPIVFGKPAKHLNEFLVEKLQIDNPSKTLFIGDNLESDIGFGAKCGYQTLLVLTGISNLDHVSNLTDAEKIPNFYIKSLGDLHNLIESKLRL